MQKKILKPIWINNLMKHLFNKNLLYKNVSISLTSKAYENKV